MPLSRISLAAAMMAGSIITAFADGIAVTPETCTRAETDIAFADFQRRDDHGAGGR